jgi:hypothetical protein
MAGQPISISTAESMVRSYVDYMTSLGVNMEEQTQDVAFTSNSLSEWMAEAMQHANEIKIFMGVYPEDAPSAGRLTVILWPYQDGERAKDTEGNEIEPFNDGQNGP